MKIKTFITNADIIVGTKTRINNTFCWTVLLYGVQSWHLTKKHINMIKYCEM